MKPLVSLMTPVYNGMPYFKEYLDSVVKQTWRPLEFICINDGSEDDTLSYLESMRPALEQAGIQLRYQTIEHKGQAQAVNTALKMVSGDFVTWCDADDILLPENIEKKAVFLMEHPQLGMVRNDGIRTENGEGEILDSLPTDRKQQNIFDALFHDLTYCYAGCYMVRTELLFACYPEKEIPISAEGQNLQLLLPPASRSDCGFLPDKLHIYRKRPDGHSGKKRSFTEAVQRMKNFTALRLEILKFCRCDEAHYTKEALEMERRNLKYLCISAAQAAREERKHENRNPDLS